MFDHIETNNNSNAHHPITPMALKIFNHRVTANKSDLLNRSIIEFYLLFFLSSSMFLAEQTSKKRNRGKGKEEKCR